MVNSEDSRADLHGVLQEPAFAELATDSVRDYLDWAQVTSRPLPAGMSAAEAWRLLGIVRQYGATWFPIPTLDDRRFWYSLTREGTRCLRFIGRYCRSESSLHRMLQEREGHRFLLRARIQEAIAACELDGVLLDFEASGHMLQQGRAPHTDAERLVHNSYEMLRELEDVDRTELFTPEFVRSLYDRITDGVDLSRVPRGPGKTNLAGTARPDLDEWEQHDRDLLQEICDFANGVTGDEFEHTAIKGYMILSAMAYWRPLPDLNETVGRHMLRLFAVRRDYPVLGYLSTSLKMRQWFDRQLAPGTTRFTTLERRPVVPGSIDGTEDILTHLQLTTAAVGELLGYIERTRREDEMIAHILEEDVGLNYRQRAILARALSHPDAEFEIRQHQLAHRVVYQTARTDLLELEARGYLERETRGKAFVFLPVADLQGLIRPDDGDTDLRV